MVRSNPIQNNFNAGEISPLLKGRPDLQSYQNGLNKCFNFIPRVQGCLGKRPGVKFVKEVKDSADRTHLVPFVFNNDNAFILEFGDQYIRFYKDRAAFEVASVHYEIASPYLAADLFDSKGIFRVKFAQSADVIYMVHPDYAPRKLSRLSNSSWTISTVDPNFPPFDELNIGTTTVYASAHSGTITLTASANLFTVNDVGTDFYIEANPTSSCHVWQVNENYSVNDIVRSGGNYYEGTHLTDGTTWTGTQTSGTVTPTHLEGTESDGNIDWEYLHSGYGYVEITGYTSATQVTAVVKSRLPDKAVGSGNATTKWSFGAWNPTVGYPDNVVFFKERLVYSRDILVWFSVVGDYDNFALKDGPDLADDMGINLTILSDQFNGIRWMYPLEDLILGTQGTIHVVGPNTRQQVFSASNIQSKPAIGRGSLSSKPAQIDNNLIFIQRSGENLLSFAFDANINNYNTTDLSLISEHLFKAGVRQMAYQERPDNVLWVIRTDGQLVALTINDNQEVRGWHQHGVGGNGIVESVAVIPSTDGNKDDLWMVVRRTINGASKRYIEYMDQYFEGQVDTQAAFFVDSGITYDGASTSTITGLSHLEGESVKVLADGAAHPDKTVSSGQITLDRNCTKAAVGLGYSAIGTTNSFEAGSQKGTAVNKVKRINRFFISLFETVGLKAGSNESNVTEIQFRDGAMAMDEAVPLFTGEKEIVNTGGFAKEAQLTFISDQPLPCTVLSVTPEMATHER